MDVYCPVENTWHLSCCFSVIIFHSKGRDHQELKKQKILVVFSCLIFPILKLKNFCSNFWLVCLNGHILLCGKNTLHLSRCFSVILFHSKGRDHHEHKYICSIFQSYFSKMRSQKFFLKFISKFVSLIVWKTNNICHVVSGI